MRDWKELDEQDCIQRMDALNVKGSYGGATYIVNSINCESLEQANATVMDYANQRGIKYHTDEHGYCHAYSGTYHVNGVEAFIFQVI